MERAMTLKRATGNVAMVRANVYAVRGGRATGQRSRGRISGGTDLTGFQDWQDFRIELPDLSKCWWNDGLER